MWWVFLGVGLIVAGVVTVSVAAVAAQPADDDGWYAYSPRPTTPRSSVRTRSS